MTNKQTIHEAIVTLDEIGIEEMDQVIAPGVVIGDQRYAVRPEIGSKIKQMIT